MSGSFRGALYRALVRCYPFKRGKGRWMDCLVRALKPRLGIRACRVGRYSVLVDPADLNDGLYYFGICGKSFSKLLQRLAKPGDVVVDVGANVGYFSLLAQDRVGPTGRVIAFEANPDLAERLGTHFANQACPIEVVHAAVWDRAEDLTFHLATNTGWSSAATNDSFEVARTVRVPSLRLDQYFHDPNGPRIRLLKVDVEGAELRVLQGAEGLFDAARIDYVVFETGGPSRLAAFESSGELLAAFMRDHGFEMTGMIQDDRLRPPVAEDVVGTTNADFVYARIGVSR